MHQNGSSWQNAHEVAAATLCVVLDSKGVSRAWPFKVAAAAPGAGKRSAATGEAGEVCSLPDGNHGDNTFEVAK